MDKIKSTLKQARELLISRSDKELINDWKEIDAKAVTVEISTVRGLIMNEIERRWPVEFNNWIENCVDDDNIENYIKLPVKCAITGKECPFEYVNDVKPCYSCQIGKDWKAYT